MNTQTQRPGIHTKATAFAGDMLYAAARRTPWLMLVLVTGGAHAVQPLEQGLQPIVARLASIAQLQTRLNQTLQGAAATPEERATAYRTYQKVDQERLRLECALAQGRRIGELPMVTYATPTPQPSLAPACRAGT